MTPYLFFLVYCGVYSDSLQLDLWTQLGFYMHTLPQNKVSRKAYFYDAKILRTKLCHLVSAQKIVRTQIILRTKKFAHKQVYAQTSLRTEKFLCSKKDLNINPLQQLRIYKSILLKPKI